MLVKIVDRCSGFTSMTSLMNKMVSREVKVDLPSNLRNDFIRGLRTIGIVCGYVYVIWLIDLINK